MCRIRKLKEALKAITISRFHCGKSKNENVIPAEAGIQVEKLDSRLRGNDKNQYPQQILDRFFGFASE